MKNKFLVIAFAAAMLSLCFSSYAQTETRTLIITESYEEINISGTQNVYFEIGPSEPITVTGDPADLDNIQIEVKDRVLIVGYPRGYQQKSKKAIEVYVKNPSLKGGGISGTGNLEIKGQLDMEKNHFSVSGTGNIIIQKIDCINLSCTISGTGNIECPEVTVDDIYTRVSGTGAIVLSDVACRKVTIKSSGTGPIEISGKCVDVDAATSGTGRINIEELKAKDVIVSSSGTGNVYCYCTGNFDGRSSGSGKVYVSGSPETVKFLGNSKYLIQR